MEPREVTAETVRAFAGVAGLELSEDQLAALAGVWRGLLQGAVALESLDLEEFEPHTIFDPRWTD